MSKQETMPSSVAVVCLRFSGPELKVGAPKVEPSLPLGKQSVYMWVCKYRGSFKGRGRSS